MKNRAIGDAVLTLGAIEYLKKCYPTIIIHYAVPPSIAPLFRSLKTSAHHIISLHFKNIRLWPKQVHYLLTEKYDLIIDLHQSGSSKRFFACFPFFPYRYHNHHRKTPSKILNQGLPLPNIQRDLDACWSLFTKKDYEKPPHYLDFMPKMTCLLPKVKAESFPLFVFGLVATRDTKQWSLTYFKELFFLILHIWPQAKVLIPFSHSLQDQELEKQWCALFPEGQLPSSLEILKVPLAELPHHLQQADCYVGNDTGLKHICASLGLPTLTFFGPEDPLEWHPYSLEKHPLLFFKSLSCRTQKEHFCGLSVCAQKTCQDILTPHMAILKIKQLSSFLTPMT